VRDLPLQVRLVDDVRVDDPEPADARGREIQSRRRPEPTGADQQDPGVEQPQLSLLADLRDQQVPAVAREPLGPESSFIKLFWSEMSQRMHDTLMDLLGPAGLCWQPGPQAIAGGRLTRSYLYYRAASLFAGTSEIQRNILAERVLGLPRSR